MNKFLVDLKDALIARVESPFFSSFVISWVALNYQVLMVILGDGKYVEKINYLNEKLYAGRQFSVQIYTFWMPLGIALAYVLVYPWIEFWYIRIALFYEARRQDISIKAQKQIPISEESRNVYFEVYDKRLEAIKARNADLGQTLDARQRSWMTLNKITEDRMRENVIVRFLNDCGMTSSEDLIRQIDMTSIDNLDYGATVFDSSLRKHPLAKNILNFLRMAKEAAKERREVISFQLPNLKIFIDESDNIETYYFIDLLIAFRYIVRSQDNPKEIFNFAVGVKDLDQLIRMYEKALQPVIES